MFEADVVIVGAGIFGLTIAEHIASKLGRRVCIIEKRRHIGGNCYSETDEETGIEFHKYGSHIFHCSNLDLWSYVNKFSSFNDYRHHVRTVHQGRVYSMPINMETICGFYNKFMSPDEARKLISEDIGRTSGMDFANLEEKAISLIGKKLYDAFIRGYTKKQWSKDPKELPAGIITRLPVRYNFNGRYFNDKYEGIPINGYGDFLRNMAKNDKINVCTGIDYFDVKDLISKEALLIYSGPIDKYFNYSCGQLGWRAIRFERDVVNLSDYQGCAVMNYADEDVPWTRIHEYKHYHPERSYDGDKTLIFREYSCSPDNNNDPSYPIGDERDQIILDNYRDLALQEKNVIFGGRLGTYRYLDMHQAIGAAMSCFDKNVVPFFEEGAKKGRNIYPELPF